MESYKVQATRLQAFLLMNVLWNSLKTIFTNAKEQYFYWLATQEWYQTIVLVRKGFGHSGGGAGGFGASAGKAKALIVVIILVLIIPLIALLFSGPTTGSSGLYGNATVAFNVRQGTASFAQFVVVILVLGAVGIVLSLI